MTQPNLSNFLHPFRFAKRLLALVALVVLFGGADAQAGNRNWSGAGGNGNWSTAGNWDTAPTDGNSVTFAGTTGLTNTNNNQVTSLNNFTFADGAGDFVVRGTNITLGGAFANNDTAGTQTVELGFIITAARNFNTANGGTTVLAGSISGTSGAMNVNSGGTTGTLILTASNSFTGAVTVTEGVLNIRNNNALGTTGTGTTVAAGGELQLQGGLIIGAESLALSSTGSGASTTTGGLRNISGNNTYGGLITLGAASRINSDADTLTLDVASGNALTGAQAVTFGGGGTIVVNDSISGLTTLTKDGAGTLTLNASNSHTGLTTVSAGVLRAANSFALGTTAAGVSVTSGAALELSNNISIDGAEALTLNGSGIGGTGALRNVSGTNTYGGAITLATASVIEADAGTQLNLTNTIGGDFLKTFDGAGIISATGVISGTTTGVTKTGAGTLTLGNAANTYGGVTTIGGGVLRAGTLAAAGTASSIGTNATIIITNGGVLEYTGATTTNARGINLAAGQGGIGVSSNAAALTISGVISNSGTLVKSGAGTLILSGNNTYSNGTLLNAGTLVAGTNTAFGAGQITINSGLLNLGNFTISNVIVNAGGTLTNVGTVTGAQLDGGTTTLSGSNSTVAVVTSNAVVNVSGANTTITNVSGGTVNVAATNSTLQTVSAGTINAATNITVQTLNGGNLAVTNGASVAVSSGTSAGSISGGGNLIKTGGSTLTLSGSNSYTGSTIISNGVLAVATNAALAGTTNVLISGGTTLAYVGGSATVTNAISVTNGTAAIRNTGGGTLTLAGSLSKNGTVLVFSNGTFNVTGVISGASANSDLVVDNATVILSNANTYVGPTFIRNAGTLNAAVVGAMPTNTRSALVMDDTGSGSSIFNVTASQEIASLTGAASSSASIATNTSLTVGTNATNTTFAGVISGGGSLVKDGASTQTLTGANTYSGGTLVSAGVLAGDTTSLQGNITNNAGIVFNQSTNGTYAGVLSGSGALTKTNAGTLTLTAANTQAGTIIGQGALQIGNGGSTGSLSGPITNNASLILNRSDNLTQSSSISGSGSLTKSGAGTVTLSAANTFSGATTVSAGTLNLNNAAGGSLGSTTNVSVANGATLLVSQSGQVNDTAAISLSGGTIRTAAGVDEAFGNLSVTSASFLDFGATFGNNNDISFGQYTPSALLTIKNFDYGSTLIFKSNLSGTISNSSFFAFENGGFRSAVWDANLNGGTFTITAIPEPSTYLAAAGLLGVMLWPSRRRIIRDAKRILGLRPPMRDRLEAMRS